MQDQSTDPGAKTMVITQLLVKEGSCFLTMLRFLVLTATKTQLSLEAKLAEHPSLAVWAIINKTFTLVLAQLAALKNSQLTNKIHK